MPTSARLRLIYFIAVGSFAAWVGFWGYLVPVDVAKALPWAVPPLHSRFIGAMYLSGMVLMFGSAFWPNRSHMRTALWMAAIWTGMLFLVSLLHLGEFDFAKPQVWFWFFAYALYPLVGAWLAWPEPRVEAGGPALSSTWRNYLRMQGAACILLALALFFVPGAMGELWPWPIPVLLTQIYAGPFLSFGIGSLLLTGCSDPRRLRVPFFSMLVFAVLVLLASLLHLGVFGTLAMAAFIWFAGFALACLGLAALLLKSLQGSRP